MPHKPLQPFFLLLLLLMGLTFSLRASNPQISLITCDPGDEMYSLFGHSAFRVVDTTYRIDRIYNYGIFDFSTPNFYGKFTQGKLEYMLGIQRTGNFMYQYEEENRSVYEEDINLTDAEAVQIVRFLDWNYKPENRFYLYDFFFDNCATKLRDILEEQLGEKLIYPEPEPEPIAFRDLLDMYTEKAQPWGDFGIDLILGLPTDDMADIRNQMFLPDFLSQNLGLASIHHEGKTEPLLGPKRTIFQARPAEGGPSFATPLLVIGLLCLGLIVYTFLGKGKRLQNTLDIVMFFLLAFLGFFWIGMWLFTNHGATYQNLNMLWTNPLFLVLAIGGLFGKFDKWNWAWTAVAGLAAFMAVFFWFSPQAYHIAVYPIILLLGARGARRMMMMRAKEKAPSAK